MLKTSHTVNFWGICSVCVCGSNIPHFMAAKPRMKCNHIIALFVPRTAAANSNTHTIPEHICCVQELAFLQRNINIYLVLFISICTLTSKTNSDAPSIKEVKWRLFLSCICSFSLFFSLQIASALFVLWDTSVQWRHSVSLEPPTLCSSTGSGTKWPPTAPCQEGNWGGSSKVRSRAVSEHGGGGNDFAWKSREKQSPLTTPGLALIPGEHGAFSPETLQYLLKVTQGCCVRAVWTAADSSLCMAGSWECWASAPECTWNYNPPRLTEGNSADQRLSAALLLCKDCSSCP